MAIDWAAINKQSRAILERLLAMEPPLPSAWSAALSEREYKAITLHINDRLTLTKTAAVLGVSRERTRQRLYRAARKLNAAGLLDQQGGG